MITTKEFDKRFDNGEDIGEYLDFSKAQSLEDFEKDRFKVKIGVTRQSIIKVWIAERLKEEQKFSLNA